MASQKIRLNLWYHPSWEGGLLLPPSVSAREVALTSIPRGSDESAITAFIEQLRSEECLDYTQEEYDNWGI